MADTNLGTAYVTIMPSLKGGIKNLKSELGDSVGEAGDSAGKSLVGSIKKVIAAAGLGKVLKDTLMEGANLQQSFGGLETLYGEAADAAKAYANEAAKAGISANSYAEQAVSFGASLKAAFGGDTAKAAEAANTAILDMADNAAKMGTPLESIQTAYQGFAKGQYQLLDNLKLGYGGTKEEMQRLLSDAEKLTGQKYDINNLGDVYSAIHAIQGELGLTGVAADEAASTFSGSFGAMQAAAKNLMGNLALGEDIQPALQTLTESVRTFLIGNLIPMVGQVLSGLPTVVSGAIDLLMQTVWDAGRHFPEIMAFALDLISNLATNIITAAPYLLEAALHLVQSIFNTLKNTDWLTLATDLVTKLSSGLTTAANDIFNTDSNIITSLINSITLDLPRMLAAGVEIATNVFNGLVDSLPQIIEGAGEIVSNILSTISENLPSVLESGESIIEAIGQGLSNLAQHLPQILSSIGKAALQMFKSIDWPGLGRAVINFIGTAIRTAGTVIGSILRGLGQTALNLFRSIDWGGLGRNVINFIVNGLRGIGSTIGNALRSLGQSAMSLFRSIDWAGVGRSVINGVVNGIRNAGHAIAQTLLGFARSALNSVKSFFGIHSPSTVFRDEIGKMIPLGMAAGIEAEAGSVTDAMDDIAQAALVDTQANLSISSGSLATGGGGLGTVVNNINITPSEGMDERRLAEYVAEQIQFMLAQEEAVWGTV